MMTAKLIRTLIIGIAISGATLIGSGKDTSLSTAGLFAGVAEARIGYPATPLSYAGVARRTTYRVVRRSTIYVATIPKTCIVETYDGAKVYRCGSTYYQAYGTQYVVVYID
jgi:hypothetical protein